MGAGGLDDDDDDDDGGGGGGGGGWRWFPMFLALNIIPKTAKTTVLHCIVGALRPNNGNLEKGK